MTGIQIVFEAAMPPQKHHKPSFARPRVDQTRCDILTPDRKQTKNCEAELRQTRRTPQNIMDIYGQGVQRSMAVVLSRTILSMVSRRGGNLPPAQRRQQRRAANSRPYGVYCSFPQHESRAHLRRRKVVCKCALSCAYFSIVYPHLGQR